MSDVIEQPGDLMRAYEHYAKKRFGQHFLTDPRILERIVDAAGVRAGDSVLEIGPGCGTLTWALLERGASVTAVEIDDDAAGFLSEYLQPGRALTVVHGDALSIDLADELDDDVVWRCASNLPYNVATEVAFRLLESRIPFERLTLMFQREVADRICAEPGSKTFGSLTLMFRLLADATCEFVLGAGAFTPPPSVQSAVVSFEPIKGTRIEDQERRATFRQIVEAAFRTRRKTLPNALKIGGFDKNAAKAALTEIGLDPRVRAEELSFEEFRALAAHF